MRIDGIVEANKSLSKRCRLNTEEGRQMAMLSVLTDISETLAILTDLYGMAHGRVISQNGENNAEHK